MTSGATFRNQAAVLIALCGSGEQERILLTQRAAHLNIHSGEVAFPGGKWEPGDAGLLETAVRESWEEVGLEPALVQFLGRLPASCTRAGMRVTPYVCRVPTTVELHANPDELESFFWVPTAFLLEDNRVRTDIFEAEGRQEWAPVYHYLGYTIWGFTARVLVQFLNRYWGAEIGRDHHAPSALYRAGPTLAE